MIIISDMLQYIGIVSCLVGWLTCLILLCTSKINTKLKHDNIALCLFGLSWAILLYEQINSFDAPYYFNSIGAILALIALLVWKRGDTYKILKQKIENLYR